MDDLRILKSSMDPDFLATRMQHGTTRNTMPTSSKKALDFQVSQVRMQRETKKYASFWGISARAWTEQREEKGNGNLYSLLSTRCSLLSTRHSQLSALYSLLSTLYSSISTLYSLLSPLSSLPSPLSSSTLYSLLSTLYSLPSTLHSLISTL